MKRTRKKSCDGFVCFTLYTAASQCGVVSATESWGDEWQRCNPKETTQRRAADAADTPLTQTFHRADCAHPLCTEAHLVALMHTSYPTQRHVQRNSAAGTYPNFR